MASKLSKAQERELRMMWDKHPQELTIKQFSRLDKVLSKLAEMGYLSKMEVAFYPYNTYTLTDSGLQLARELFGSNEPDPQPERMVTNFVTDDSELDDVLIDEPVPSKPLASFKIKARIGEVRDYTGSPSCELDMSPMTARDAMLATEPVLAKIDAAETQDTASVPVRLTWRGNRKQAVKQVAEALCRNWQNLDSEADYSQAVDATLKQHCAFETGDVQSNYNNIRNRLIKDAQSYLENNANEFTASESVYPAPLTAAEKQEIVVNSDIEHTDTETIRRGVSVESKVCTKCGEEKPLSEFYKAGNTRSGRHSKCIECAKEDNRNTREKKQRFRQGIAKPNMQKRVVGVVYFVLAPSAKRVKIGIVHKRDDIAKRLKNIQGSSPIELTLIGIIETKQAAKLEREFHVAFKECWLYGEWFEYSTLIADFIRINAEPLNMTFGVVNHNINTHSPAKDTAMNDKSRYASKLNGDIKITFQRIGILESKRDEVHRAIVSYQHPIDLRNRKNRRADAFYMARIGTSTIRPLLKPFKAKIEVPNDSQEVKVKVISYDDLLKPEVLENAA